MRDTVKPSLTADEVKSCCARIYEQDFVNLLLGDSFHPGGLDLTSELGRALELTAESRVLDVAAGKGTSALHLAATFNCKVVGVDYGTDNVREANERALRQGLSDRVRFKRGDSEALPFARESFDAVICECALCTFPDKTAAAREFHRVLRPGGKVGLSDITRTEALPKELQSLMAWIACIADSRPVAVYSDLLLASGFRVDAVSSHDEALDRMLRQIHLKLLGLEIAVGLKKLDLPGLDFDSAKQLASAASSAVANGQLGYSVLIATRL